MAKKSTDKTLSGSQLTVATNDPVHAFAIDERMKQLGRSARYLKELSKITKEKNLPGEWATPEQRSRAALNALGKYF
jgi:hypothetical protein